MGATLPALLALPMRLEARSTLRLWGQVQHQAAGVPGAQVIVAGRDTCRCDEFGNYSFADLPMGPLQLRVSAPGFAPLRQRLWLRKEAFLTLELQLERHLTEGFAADSLQLPGAGLAAPRDLDRDGREDAAGWQPLAQPVQVQQDGLPREDPWGGLWLESDTGPTPTGERAAGWQPLGLEGFFSNRGLTGWRQARPRATGPALWLERPLAGALAAGGRTRLRLGLWHELDLQARLEQASGQAPELGRGQGGAQGVVEHRWLAARHLLLGQTLQLGRLERRRLSTELPRLWLPQASLEALAEAELRQRQLAWQGRATWLPAGGGTGEVRLWWRERRQETRGLELDRPTHRLLVTGDLPERAWFDTRRVERRRALGLRMALEQAHARGLLQGAVGVESHHRRLDAALGANPLLPGGRDPWLALDEDDLLLEARLRDRWDWTPRFSFEACLDLRYHFYELRRRPVGLFQLGDVPDAAFNQDLLALEPRLALLLRPGSWGLDLAWQRRLSMAGPGGAWDLGRSPDRLWDLPLVAPVGSEGELETLLPAIQLDEVALRGQRPLGRSIRLNLGLWGRSWHNLPLAGWTPRESTLDLAQLLRPLNALQAGLEAGLRLEGRAGHGSLEGRWSRLRAEGRRWRPLPDTSLWVGQEAVLRRLPGEAAWSARLEAGTRLSLAGWSLAPAVQVSAMGARDPENQAGWTPELPGAAWLDAELRLEHARTPGWSLALWGRNLGRDPHPAAGWVDWRAGESVAVQRTLAAPGRLLGVRVAWEPGR
ncbi:MAG: carboxypeptidase-like regulatory domain-containing protein [Candidatus Delongbacteria bacterium]